MSNDGKQYSNIPLQQHYILPREVPLLNGFAKDHLLRVRYWGHAGRTWERGCDDSPRKGNCCSEVTWPIQSENIINVTIQFSATLKQLRQALIIQLRKELPSTLNFRGLQIMTDRRQNKSLQSARRIWEEREAWRIWKERKERNREQRHVGQTCAR